MTRQSLYPPLRLVRPLSWKMRQSLYPPPRLVHPFSWKAVRIVALQVQLQGHLNPNVVPVMEAMTLCVNDARRSSFLLGQPSVSRRNHQLVQRCTRCGRRVVESRGILTPERHPVFCFYQQDGSSSRLACQLVHAALAP